MHYKRNAKKKHSQKPYLGVQLQTLCVHNSDIFDLTSQKTVFTGNFFKCMYYFMWARK